MKKTTEKETHDFMKVESFFQLPFIRQAETKQKAVGVKLFGIELGNGDTNNPPPPSNGESEEVEAKVRNRTENNIETNRSFECHYCCRNFSTSQALGGHQNAHKRERQHTKRAHLQSAMLHGSLTEYSHVCGFANYRQSSVSTIYPAWNINHRSNTIANGIGRMYGSHGILYYNTQRPINGSPLCMRRNPTVQSSPTLNHERLLHPLPLFAGEDISITASQIVGSSSQIRFGANCDPKPRVEEHVSLDLHL